MPTPCRYLGGVGDVLGAAGQLFPILAAVAAGGRQLPAQLHKLLGGQEVSGQVVLDVLFKPSNSHKAGTAKGLFHAALLPNRAQP